MLWVLAEENPLTGLEPPHLHIYNNLSRTNRMFCRNGCWQEKLHKQQGVADAEGQLVVAQRKCNKKKKMEMLWDVWSKFWEVWMKSHLHCDFFTVELLFLLVVWRLKSSITPSKTTPPWTPICVNKINVLLQPSSFHQVLSCQKVLKCHSQGGFHNLWSSKHLMNKKLNPHLPLVRLSGPQVQQGGQVQWWALRYWHPNLL